MAKNTDLENIDPNSISNLFKGRKPKGRPANTPNPNAQGVRPAVPINPSIELDQSTQAEGIGSQYIDQNIQGTNDPVLETPTLNPEVDVESLIASYRTRLQEGGFKDDDDNLSRLIEANPDPNNINDFSSLDTPDDVVVKAPEQLLKESNARSPIIPIMLGILKPLEIVGDAFSRYEAAKVGFLEKALKGQPLQAIKEGAEGVSARNITEFQDAKLRGSNLPEFGDFFRAKGVPEWLAATGGVLADFVTDLPLGFGAASILKGLGKGSAKAGAKVATETAAKHTAETLMKARSSEFGKIVENAIMGKGTFDVGPAPEAFKAAQRAAFGESGDTMIDAAYLADRLRDTITKQSSKVVSDITGDLGVKGIKELSPQQASMKTINKALKGDLDSLGKLSPEVQTYVKSGRTIISKEGTKLVSTLMDMAAKDPEQFAKFSERFDTGRVAGKILGPQELAQAITNNTDSYVSRAYELFENKAYKPSKEATRNAINGLIADGGVATKKEATDLLRYILDQKQFPDNKKIFGGMKVKSGNIIARKEIPEYLRDFMGEINDPSWNLKNTVKNITETNTQLKIFQAMKDLGMTSKTPSKEFSARIPDAGPFAWGAVSGLYTSPEVHGTLRGMQVYTNTLDEMLKKVMNPIKTAKTVFNPKGQAHNALGNIFVLGPLSGVSAFTHPKEYVKAVELLKKAKLVREGKLPTTTPEFVKFKQLTKEGALGTEFVANDNIQFFDDFLKAADNDKHNVVLKYTKKTADALKESYTSADAIPKIAFYLAKEKEGKLKGADIVAEMYKWFPNYREASTLSQVTKNSGAGLFLANPFMTFRTEAHRIFINAAKDPSKRWMLGALLGSRAGYNAAVLGHMGLGFKDIAETFMTRPELLAETVLNPFDETGNFDFNSRYIDPFNTQGLFAPLMSASGATGVHPLDYVLDLTALSPEFGYSNLITNALEPAITGKGRFGEDLSFGDRVKQTLGAVGPTSLTVDLPRGVEALAEGDNPEALRRAFRFFGIDVEKRNPDYIKSKVSKRLKDKLQRGLPIDTTVRAINALGFDGERMAANAAKAVEQGKVGKGGKPLVVLNSPIDRAFRLLEDEKTR